LWGGAIMHYVKTNTKLVGTLTSFAAQDMGSLFRRFESLQNEMLHAPTETSCYYFPTSILSPPRIGLTIFEMRLSGSIPTPSPRSRSSHDRGQSGMPWDML